MAKYIGVLIAFMISLCARTAALAQNSTRVYSQDHTHFAFVKADPRVFIDPEIPEPQPATIFVGDTKSGNSHSLFEAGKKVSIPEFGDALVEMVQDLSFNNDSSSLYFLIKASTTSSAVIAVDLQTKRVRYICPGNSVKVIASGKWKNNLIVEKHKYRKSGDGSYNWQYIVSPTGKELAIYSRDEP